MLRTKKDLEQRMGKTQNEKRLQKLSTTKPKKPQSGKTKTLVHTNVERRFSKSLKMAQTAE